MKVLGVIPARYSSSRFPGKPLARIGGKTMIEWTYSNSFKSKAIDRLVVATDSELIEKEVLRFGGEVVMTSSQHLTGTDRIIEVAKNFKDVSFVVNIQGDEPGIEDTLISGVAEMKKSKTEWEVVTAATSFQPSEDPNDPNRVKVVFDRNNKALYFSRSLIPSNFKKNPMHYRHLGIYAYNRDYLLNIPNLKISDWEEAESLEQLRFLQNGATIGIFITSQASLAVDTPEDLDLVITDFKNKNLI